MYAYKINIFVILSLSIATVMMGTIALSVLSPVFAGGDSNVIKDNVRQLHNLS